jgi:hypothetical protein
MIHFAEHARLHSQHRFAVNSVGLIIERAENGTVNALVS